MCKVKAPKPQVIEQDKPVFARNPYLDDSGNSRTSIMRRGRSSLVIPTETGIGFSGRGDSSGLADLGDPLFNSRGPGGRSGGGTPVYGVPGVTTPRGNVPGAAPGPTRGGPTPSRPGPIRREQ